MGGGKRYSLRVITSRRRYDTSTALLRAERGNLVVSTANLERKNRLQILTLDQDAITEPTGQDGGNIQRRFSGNVIYSRLQNTFYIISRHYRCSSFSRSNSI